MTPTLLSSILLFAAAITAAHAQPSYNDPTSGSVTFRPSVAIIIAIFSLMFSITFLLLMYAKFCHNIQRGGAFLHNGNDDTFLLTADPNRTSSGIDKTVIESLPFFRFSTLRGKRDGLECAVCLSKFDDMEILRLLPKCKHAFHVDCIDRWLESHSTCPLCRLRIDPDDAAIFNCCSNSTRSLFRDPSRREIIDGNTDTTAAMNDLELFLERETEKKENHLWKRNNNDKDQELLHKHKHKILVSGAVFKGRWSDLNSSDLVSLDSEMLLDVISSKSHSNTSNDTDSIRKVKEEMGKKRVLESKANKIRGNLETTSPTSIDYSFSRAALLSQGNYSFSRAALLSQGNKCMSDITGVPRFQASGSSEDDKVRRLWLPIAQRTVRWFNRGERRPEFESTTTKEAAIDSEV